MKRVRIRCHAPPDPPREDGRPFAVGFLPSLHDAEIVVVDDDGTETEIPGVSSVAWEVSATDTSLARLTIHGAEIDVDAGLVEIVARRQREGASP